MKILRKWQWTAQDERRHQWMGRWMVLAGLGIASVLFIISCASGNRLLVAPPNVPGATFVGSEACADCHDPITRDFHTAEHARLQVLGENAQEAGCESCHGPGSRHIDTGGAADTIVNPLKSPTICFQCHLNIRGQFNLPYRHPVMEGQISCGNCHDPHKGPAFKGGGTLLASANEVCLECHQAQRGPHVFEHEAVREGCVLCHHPHGSVNDKMLVQRNAALCLKCHVQASLANVQVGGIPHSSLLRIGTCWTAGCHEAVHGSQVSTSLRY